MSDETKQLTKQEDQPVSLVSAENLISEAIKNKVPVETMERLLKMRRELKAEFAKEQFDNAMADFQADCPEIKKTKVVKTKTGQEAYRYAPIETIISQVKSLLKKNGFSYSIQTITGENKVKSVCIVKHISGHKEEYEMEVPLGNKTQVMSDSQVVAAAATFSKRYAFCNAFGILTGDEDNDGNTNNVLDKKTNTYQQAPDSVKNQVKPAQNGELCQRCYKDGKKTRITQREAEYSQKVHGYKLCRACQKLALEHSNKNVKTIKHSPQEKSKAETNTNDQGVDDGKPVTEYQLKMIKSISKGKFGNNDDMTIMSFLQMYGIEKTTLNQLTHHQGKLAIEILSAYKAKQS